MAATKQELLLTHRSKRIQAIPTSIHGIITKFRTYEDYLDSQITEEHLKYLESKDIARELIELGYKGSGEVLTRSEFYYWKTYAEKQRDDKREGFEVLTKKRTEKFVDNFLQALADREKENLDGDINSIIFIRTMNSKNQEVSSYIDFCHRLQTENFDLYFEGKKKRLPKADDLSYFNWITKTCVKNPTPNYDVLTERIDGMQFRSRKDGKIITPGVENPGDDTVRNVIDSPHYHQIVIYDHVVRNKITVPT